MKIFISWAKPQGNRLAVALKETILHVEGLDAWVSSKDIAFGVEWFPALKKSLKKADRALVCLTRDVADSPWVFFEVGALWARLKNVSVLAFGIDKDELPGNPLQQIQWARGDSKDDVTRLLAKFVESDEDRERIKQHVEDSWEEWKTEIQKITEPLAETEANNTVTALGRAVYEALDAQKENIPEFEFRRYSELSTELAEQRLPFDLALNGLLKVRSVQPRIRSYGEVSMLIKVVPDVLSFSHIKQAVEGAKMVLGRGVKVSDNIDHHPWDTFVFIAGTRFDFEFAIKGSKHRMQERTFVIGGEAFKHTDYINLFLLEAEGKHRFLNMSPHAWMDTVLETICLRWPQS